MSALPSAPSRASDRHEAAQSERDPTPSGAAPLSIRGVCKRWAADQPPALDDVELDLREGTITWVGGRNGAGKTTMLRIAAGLIAPDAGTVHAWGLTPARNRVRYQQLVSFLPAGDRGLYARLTVRRQLEFCARIALLAPGRVGAAVDHAIATFDLAELGERRVDRLSTGQRQRLRIAMTFLPDPDVLLLDEPLANLDSEGSALLRSAIERLLAREGAVLWCSPSGGQLDIPVHAQWVLEAGRLESA